MAVHEITTSPRLAEILNSKRCKIYCSGDLLHTVQTKANYDDSKMFVDRKMKFSEDTTLANFELFMTAKPEPNQDDVQNFVDENFDDVNTEFSEWQPSDFKETPEFVKNIENEAYRNFSLDLNKIWKELGRKMKDDVKTDEAKYSIIYLKNPIIVPGDRFREVYYWDTYWIVLGLLHCEMKDTVKGMLENFAQFIDEIGHIPNGGRVYYLERSQPPLYLPMVQKYKEVTDDSTFIKDNIDIFKKEVDYWLNNHEVEVSFDEETKHKLFVYGKDGQGPRPESYVEDFNLASDLTDENEKNNLYSELKAAAESGWDFSSRWFVKDGTNEGDLKDIKARSIIPVDLNAFIHWNLVILSEWCTELGDADAENFKTRAVELQTAINAVLWNEEKGIWFDYDLINKKQRDYFYVSNFAPLWTKSYDQDKRDDFANSAVKYLNDTGAVLNGGVPTSMYETGEQWDYPNAWAPLVHYLIVGLDNTENEEAQELAYKIAESWVKSNYEAFNDTGAMFEKYDATRVGSGGSGGEYEVQKGFGWTNGVILDLLSRYGDRLETNSATQNVFTRAGHIFVGLVALAVGYFRF